MPRRASFMGSLNRNLFLNDPTGSRRFFVIPIKSIHFPTNFSPDGLMAQAYKMFLDGYNYKLSPSEISQIMDYNENFALPISELELIQKFYEPADVPDNLSPQEIKDLASVNGWILMTATEILQDLQDSAGKINLSLRMLGLTLQKINAKQILIRDGNLIKRIYILKKKSDSSSVVQSPKYKSQFNDQDDDDDEMPF
jgi:hypothetical protein